MNEPFKIVFVFNYVNGSDDNFIAVALWSNDCFFVDTIQKTQNPIPAFYIFVALVRPNKGPLSSRAPCWTRNKCHHVQNKDVDTSRPRCRPH